VSVREPIHRFLAAARRAGVRISTAEAIDAFAALDLVGFADRTTVRDTLGIVLAKTDDDRRRFERAFDAYFAADGSAFAPSEDSAVESDAIAEATRRSELARMLIDEDLAGIVLALHRASEAVDLQHVRIFTQINPYARRILEAMGIAELDDAIGYLRGSQATGAAAGARFLEQRRRALAERARDMVERRLGAYAEAERDRLHDAFLRDVRLTNVDRRDVDRMRTLVRAMARRLATRYGRRRRRARRGQLDARHTIRRNVGHDGIPFTIVWKRRKIEKPRVIALCDVSGSVAPIAHFLLLFLYTLNEAVSGLRSFAFSSDLIEVSTILERETIDDATAQIMRTLGFRSSDYGRSLATFADGWMDVVDRKTTVVILGDGRSNYGNPRADVIKAMYERAHRVVWLNPEYPSSWGTADSEMWRYAAHCHVATVCNRLSDLERAISGLLR
jgi:uncharacterized protein with von Willebrand factor type A (vWA) domain